MTRDEAERLITWLQETADRVEYGEIGIVLKIHAGEIRFVNHHIDEVLKPKTVGNHEARL